MTKVLVVGGTNFIGPEAVRALSAQGAEVTILHRGEHEEDLGEIPHIHADRADLVVHCAAVRPDVVLDMAPIHASHAETVLAAALGTDVPRVVVVSSVDTYRAYDVLRGRDTRVQSVPLHEESETRVHRHPYRDDFEAGDPMRDYDKLDVEDILLGSEDVEGVVLRLPAVFGPKDPQHRLYPALRRMADAMPVIVLPAGLGAWRFGKAYRSNVADAIALACLHPAAADRIFNVGSFTGTEAEWTERVGCVVGWDGEVVLVPDERVPGELRPPIDVRQHLVADTERIRAELGWSERVGLDDAIAITAEWELAHPPEGFSYDPDVELAAAGR